jgi:pimeloyl-ACP methyl ester carboxylesterase
MDAAPQAMPPNAVPFTVETRNLPQATISAWHLPATKSHGTVFVSHGFRNNKSYMSSYAWIRDRLNWDMVYFDYREHGDSSDALLHFPTLGYYEIWDAKAVVDWAEAKGLPKPYVMMAPSMGGAISLRFAGYDKRISGVLAFGPYHNGWQALHEFRFRGIRMGRLADLIIHGSWRRAFQSVDVPTAVAQRNDLRIWITCGQYDWFDKTGQQRILDASKSPASMKKLFVIPGGNHGNWWRWEKMDGTIEAFLNASE